MKNLKFAGLAVATLAFLAGCSPAAQDGAQLLVTGDVGLFTYDVNRSFQREGFVMEHNAGGDVTQDLHNFCQEWANVSATSGDPQWLANCENPDYVWDRINNIWELNGTTDTDN